MTKRTLTAVLLTAAIALTVGIKVGGQAGSRAITSSALPPASIPTFSTENLGRMAHFYVGGNYVGEPGKEYMDGAMYVELWAPKQVRQPYPIVMFHGNGQTGAVWPRAPARRTGRVSMVRSACAPPPSCRRSGPGPCRPAATSRARRSTRSGRAM